MNLINMVLAKFFGCWKIVTLLLEFLGDID